MKGIVRKAWSLSSERDPAAGHSLVEVMIAMVLASLGLVAGLGMAQVADRGLQQGMKSTRALTMAESRLEAKRASAWSQLLLDDVNHDGVAETVMRDDGVVPDEVANDGTYTASADREGIHLVWAVALSRNAPLASVASAVITARASYPVEGGYTKEIQLGTLRANPAYVGAR